ncbi:MAG TPA: hypothetical protein VE264_02760 [Nitrososphaera sp.]|nr:hypothetical protein [Nitrososphaera sp.]
MGTKVAITLPLSLLVLSILTFPQQTPMVAYNNTKIYDKDFVTVLREIGSDVPEGASIITSANGPQLAYFSEHEIKIPRGVDSLRSLVEYMQKHNSNYLVAFEGKSSEDNLQPLFTRSGIAKFLTRSFEEIANYTSESQKIHLFHLRSNITQDNIITTTDITRPLVSITSPLNDTIIEARSNHVIFRINVTGTSYDADSKIKMVEVFMEDFPYKPANPKSENDWSIWSFSDFVTSEGEKLIVARATDNAGNMQWFPINVTATFDG